MARRISVSPLGSGSSVGTLDVQGNTISTAQTNDDLILDANGTGTVQIDTELVIRNQGDLRLLEATVNGTNYVAMHASSAMAANYTITWPNAVAGTNGFVLTSDTSGNLSWTSPGSLGIAVADPGAVATVHYPVFSTNAGALPTTLNSPNVRANLSFVPSTGELLHPILSGASTASATLTIRGTSNATKATASVLMTDNVTSTSTTTGTLVVTGGVGVSGALFVGGGITGNVGSTWTTISSGTTATNLTNYFCNTNTAPFTLTLPATPSADNAIRVVDLAGSFDRNNLTIGRNGVLIMGRAEDLILNVRNSSVTLVYSGATYGWKLV